MTDAHQPHIHDFEAWEYPEFHADLVPGFMMEPEDESDTTIECREETAEPEPPQDPIVVELPPEPSTVAQILYLDTIGSQMTDRLAEIDASLLHGMVELVRRVVKKIILKELRLDETLIKKMIEQSLEKINKDKAHCVIHVAEEDYAVFENQSYLSHVQIKVDPDLIQGDFIIKTQYSKLHALLEERLTVLFGQ